MLGNTHVVWKVWVLPRRLMLASPYAGPLGKLASLNARPLSTRQSVVASECVRGRLATDARASAATPPPADSAIVPPTPMLSFPNPRLPKPPFYTAGPASKAARARL